MRQRDRSRLFIRSACVGACTLLLASARTAAHADATAAAAEAPSPVCQSNAAPACRAKCERGPIRDASGAPVSMDYRIACDEIGRMYRDGQSGVGAAAVAKNAGEAKKYFAKACQEGWWAGCSDLAGVLLKESPTLESKARSLYDQACSLAVPRWSHEACFASGEMCEQARGGPKDLPAAKAAYQKACDGGDARGCSAIARIDPPTTKAVAPAQSTSAPAPKSPPGAAPASPSPPRAPANRVIPPGPPARAVPPGPPA